jgi:hypothetical protein
MSRDRCQVRMTQSIGSFVFAPIRRCGGGRRQIGGIVVAPRASLFVNDSATNTAHNDAGTPFYVCILTWDTDKTCPRPACMPVRPTEGREYKTQRPGDDKCMRAVCLLCGTAASTITFNLADFGYAVLLYVLVGTDGRLGIYLFG